MTHRIATWMTALTVLAMLALPGRVAAQQHSSAPYPYILIDLGTFGGPQTGVGNFPVPALNNSGEVAGTADTTVLDPYAPNDNPAFNQDPYVQHTFLWHHGVLSDLGALGAQPATNSSYPNQINAQGDEAGLSDNGITDTVTGYPEAEAVLWTRGQMINLGTFGGNEGNAWALNDRDQVVGTAANTITDPFSMLGWGTQTRAFLWQHGRMQDLGTLGGPDAIAWLVNDRGQVAGSSYTNAIINPVTGQPTTHPFLWQDGHMQDLGTLGGSVSTYGGVMALNNRGEAVGQSDLAGDQYYHPYLWDGHALTDLGTLGGNYGSADAINDLGEIVGWATTPGDVTNHAVLWRHGGMTDLGTVAGDAWSVAVSINALGQIVGNSGTFSSCITCIRGFLWQHSTMVDVNTLVAPSDLHVTEAQFINDRGEIVGNGQFPNGQQHQILLIPTGLAASESITSNAPAPGTTGSAVAVQRRSVACLWRPAWLHHPTVKYHPRIC